MAESIAEMMLKGGFGTSLSGEDIERGMEGMLQEVDHLYQPRVTDHRDARHQMVWGSNWIFLWQKPLSSSLLFWYH
jgi:hypothetical protein